jgi:CHASE3 domain sensor protein
MPVSEEVREKTVDEILQKANQRLRMELQIQPDDPLLSVLALNEELFKAYTEAIKLSLKEAQFDISAATKLEIQAAKELAGRMIDNTAGHLKDQLLEVGNTWETQFKKTADDELAKIHLAAKFAYIGAGAFALAGAIFLSMALGNFLGLVMKH